MMTDDWQGPQIEPEVNAMKTECTLSQIEGVIGKIPSGTMGGFAAIVLWSTTVAFARSLSEQLGPLTAAAAVYSVGGTIAAIRLLFVGGSMQRFRGLPLSYLAGCGVLFLSYMLLLFLAVGLAEGRQQVLEVGLLNYLWPALTILLSVVLLNKRASLLLIPATLLALSGVVVVLTQGRTSPGSRSVEISPAIRSRIRLGWGLRCPGRSIPCSLGDGPAAKGKGAVDLFLPTTAGVLLLVCLFASEPRAWSPSALEKQYSWEWPPTWRTGFGTRRCEPATWYWSPPVPT